MKWWMFLIYLLVNYGTIYATLVFVSTLFDEFSFRVFEKKRYYFVVAIFTTVMVVITSLIKFLGVLPITFIMVNEFLMIALIMSFVYFKYRTTWYVPFIVVSIYWVFSMFFEIPISVLLNIYIPVEEFLTIEIQLIGSIYLTLTFLFSAGLLSMVQKKLHFRLELPRSIVSYLIMTPIVMLVVYNVIFAKLYPSALKDLTIYSLILLFVCQVLLIIYLAYRSSLESKEKTIEIEGE